MMQSMTFVDRNQPLQLRRLAIPEPVYHQVPIRVNAYSVRCTVFIVKKGD